MDAMEFVLSIVGRDTDRAGAILGSWRWLFHHRRRIRERRRQRHEIQVLSDEELRRLQVGGASRLKRFFVLLVREGLDRARGILPPEALEDHELDADAVGFAAAFSEEEEFDEIPESRDDGAAPPAVTGPDVVSLAGRRRGARRSCCGSSGRATSS